MSTSLYISQNYRLFLKEWIESQETTRGLLSKLASMMNCQNSHLTRVLREEEHLTPDQAFEACRFMKLSESESEFYLKLVSYERASNPSYRKQLYAELKKIKEEQENLSKRYKFSSMEEQERIMIYYSSWYWSAIHILTDISQFQTSKAIAERLGLDEQDVRSYLQTLESFNLVKRQGDTWKFSSGSMMLPKTSPMHSIQHGNWRTRAIADSQNKSTDGLHFTMVQAISKNDFEVIKQLILKVLDDYKAVANPSKSEELICFSFDFFKV